MREQRGFTLLEVLVAMVILSIGVIAVLQLFPHSLRQVRLSAERTQAAQLADSRFGQLRAGGVGNELALWASDNSLHTDLLNLAAGEALYSGYTSTVQRVASAGEMYRVTFVVLMPDGRHETFVTYVTNQ